LFCWQLIEQVEKMFQPQIHPLIRALPAIALLVGGLALVLLLFG
jgi:hypothetical protein